MFGHRKTYLDMLNAFILYRYKPRCCLSPICVPKKVGVNEKNINKNDFFIKKKGRGIKQRYRTKLKMTGCKLGRDVHW